MVLTVMCGAIVSCSGWWMALVGAIVSVVASFCLFLLKPPAMGGLGHKRPLLHDNDYVSYH
jgi:hypothetical protein